MSIIIEGSLSSIQLEKALLDGANIKLSETTKARMAECYKFLKDFSSDKVIYGINTGFGPMAQYRVDGNSLNALQYNIIRSHATGAGSPLPDLYVRAAMTARLMTFAQARSGVHPDLADLMIEMINREIYPLTPEHGGVGASGDLVQLAHIALALTGEGEVRCRGEWMPAAQALAEHGLKPFRIRIREGLALANGTSVMAGIGAINAIYAERLLHRAVLASVWVNEISASYDDAFSGELNGTKKHAGQQRVASLMREIAEGSSCMLKRENKLFNGECGDRIFTHKVQPYYSLRCVPQVLGPIWDEVENARKVTLDEINSACDNPIVDPESRNIYHGGNFHGDYISYEMDKLKIAVTKLTMLMERQLNYLCHDKVNGILPPFLNLGTLGLNYGLQATQFTATSTTAENQTLSNPMSIHSISCNNDNQDIVSMGTNSALIAATVIRNSWQVMAIQYMALAQAVDCLGIASRLSPATRRAYEGVRNIFPTFVEDNPKHKAIEALQLFLMKSKA
ncbi:MAG: aromatic amino acid ammonia-lyase [Tannerellaceae bacterium]|jgi:histidine ammonia-lyase|nr:aromatic amino acid ammonia-lyase [Tannerellaceae bacterium]